MKIQALTQEQIEAIVREFNRRGRPRADAQALLSEWPTIMKTTAFWRVWRREELRPSSEYYTEAEKATVLRRLDKELRQCSRTIRQVESFVSAKLGLQTPHHRLVVGLLSRVLPELEKLEQETALFKRRLTAEPTTKARRRPGRLWLDERAMLEVLAAFFKSRRWPVSQDQSGLYAAVALIVLPGERTSMNVKRLKHLSSFAEPYEELLLGFNLYLGSRRNSPRSSRRRSIT